MANFVLVHGTGCGGWVWQKLSPLLRDEGHVVYSPTLTGLADRSQVQSKEVNLTTHITDIVNLIYYEDLTDVILVGNSYAGMVITGVAAQIPDRIKLLIYLDAYLPDGGQSEADLLPANMLADRKADAALHNGYIQPPPPQIFGVTDPILENWAIARMTPHPFATYTEPVQTGDGRSAIIPGIFIHCTGNPVTTPDLFAASATKARMKGWKVVDLNAGHLAMLTSPRELADLLLQVERKY